MHKSKNNTERQFVEAKSSVGTEVLSGHDLELFLKHYEGDFRDRIFSPSTTLTTFIGQALASDKPVLSAVTRFRAECAVTNQRQCAINTSSYVRARQRIPLQGIIELAKNKAALLSRNVEEAWLWKGRHAKLLDGTTFTASDTVANQMVYPQHPNQKKGLGFPLIRMSLMTSLATGAALDIELGPFSGKHAGEISLSAKLLENLEQNDVLVADKYYLTYFFIALVSAKRADFLTKHFDHRKFNILHSKRINEYEEIITIKRPQRPHTGWLKPEEYALIPEILRLRKSKINIGANGSRKKWITVVTTLTDHVKYTAHDLAQLYYYRWNIELDLRVIKQTMGMNFIAAKTPEMIAKEVWIRILAYNVVRILMGKAATDANTQPRKLSFKGCLNVIVAYQPKWRHNQSTHNRKLLDDMLDALSKQIVMSRPGRSEPRAVKRRHSGRNIILQIPRAAMKKAA